MSDISIAKHQIARDVANRKEVTDLKRQQEVFQKQISKIKSDQEKIIQNLEKDYQVQIENDRTEYSEKINKIRDIQLRRLTEEEAKLDDTLREIKISHHAKVSELKESHEKEIEREVESQTKYLENARRRFNEQKSKYET